MIIQDADPLYLPIVGDNQLKILNRRVIELTYIVGKTTPTSSVSAWNFVDSSFLYTPPTGLTVTVDSVPVGIVSTEFKRRPLYAPLEERDLRILAQLYITVNRDINSGSTVSVTNPDKTLFPPAVVFSETKSSIRINPAIHVAQCGYESSMPKFASIGYYMGSGNELDVTYLTQSKFSIVDSVTKREKFTGSISLRKDVGYNYTPTPYQKVLQVDFTPFKASGSYQLLLPDLGCSLPFFIGDGVLLNLSRTMTLGFLNQRCGYNVKLPYSRHEHTECHKRPAYIPVPSSNFTTTWNMIADNSNDIKSPSDMLYPYIKTGSIDVSCGHHDAGDYSKYLISSGIIIHSLTFAVDNVNAGAYDNLGIPESGDGKSDVLQIAKWEADFVLKMQDLDGGFFTLCYPKDMSYELNSSLQGTNVGEEQCVWPKSVWATGIAVGALAELASSPTFKQQFGLAAVNTYLTASVKGWEFIMNSITKYGIDGAHQQIRNSPLDSKECISYAAASMFTATGNKIYHDKLLEWFDPNDPNTIKWSWMRLYQYYGCAIRNYAFAVKSGRRNVAELSSQYLMKCENQITASANDILKYSTSNAYGAALPLESKGYSGGTVGWFYVTEQCFDLVTGYLLNAKQEYINAGMLNVNYLGGCNPVNISTLSGFGLKRPRTFVSQYQLNDYRIMPPNGFIQGSISPGVPMLGNYTTPDGKNELSTLIFPQDYVNTSKYPFYDRFTDTWNTTDEWTVAPAIGKGLPFSLWLTNFTNKKSQPWNPSS